MLDGATLLSLEEAYNMFLAILGVTDRMVGVENAPTGDTVANNRTVTDSSSMIMCNLSYLYGSQWPAGPSSVIKYYETFNRR